MTNIKLILLLCFFVQVTVSAQVKIGDNPNTINSASLLELETTNKGFVLPRVQLTNIATTSPLPSGLLTGTVVYNTNASVVGGDGIGTYVWNGSAWKLAENRLLISAVWSLTGNAGTNSGTNFLGTTDNVSIRFKTNNIERMVIDSNGRVGIGTTNPLNALSVIATNPLYLSGLQATSTLSTDSVLTINGGVVKKAPVSNITGGGGGSGWLTTGNDNTTVNSNSFLGSVAGTFVPLLFKAQGDTVGYLGLNNSSYAVAFGAGSSGANTAFRSVAVGAASKASAGNESVAIGYNAVAGSFHDIAIGANAQTANSTANMAIGTGAIATSNNAIAIGPNAEASTNTITLALGVSATSTGFTSMAIGNGARSTDNNTTAFGALAQATVIGANAFGNRSKASAQNSLALGNSSTASGTNSIALGDNATASDVNAISIGNTAQSTKQNATAIGDNSTAGGLGSTVIGNASSATGTNGIIFGDNSSSTSDNTIIIGTGITSNQANAFILGGSGTNVGIGTTTPNTTARLDVNGTFKLGVAGTVLTNIIKGTVNFSLPSITTGATSVVTATVTGANTNSTVMISPRAQLPSGYVIAYAFINAANTLTIGLVNNTTTGATTNFTFDVTVMQ